MVELLNAHAEDKHPEKVEVLLPVSLSHNDIFLNIGTCFIKYDTKDSRSYGVINSTQPINLEWYVYIQTNEKTGAFEAIIFYDEPQFFPLSQLKIFLPNKQIDFH